MSRTNRNIPHWITQIDEDEIREELVNCFSRDCASKYHHISYLGMEYIGHTEKRMVKKITNRKIRKSKEEY